MTGNSNIWEQTNMLNKQFITALMDSRISWNEKINENRVMKTGMPDENITEEISLLKDVRAAYLHTI